MLVTSGCSRRGAPSPLAGVRRTIVTAACIAFAALFVVVAGGNKALAVSFDIIFTQTQPPTEVTPKFGSFTIDPSDFDDLPNDQSGPLTSFSVTIGTETFSLFGGDILFSGGTPGFVSRPADFLIDFDAPIVILDVDSGSFPIFGIDPQITIPPVGPIDPFDQAAGGTWGIGETAGTYTIVLSPDSNPIPEPATLSLLAIGLTGIAGMFGARALRRQKGRGSA